MGGKPSTRRGQLSAQVGDTYAPACLSESTRAFAPFGYVEPGGRIFSLRDADRPVLTRVEPRRWLWKVPWPSAPCAVYSEAATEEPYRFRCCARVHSDQEWQVLVQGISTPLPRCFSAVSIVTDITNCYTADIGLQCQLPGAAPAPHRRRVSLSRRGRVAAVTREATRRAKAMEEPHTPKDDGGGKSPTVEGLVATPAKQKSSVFGDWTFPVSPPAQQAGRSGHFGKRVFPQETPQSPPLYGRLAPAASLPALRKDMRRGQGAGRLTVKEALQDSLSSGSARSPPSSPTHAWRSGGPDAGHARSVPVSGPEHDLTAWAPRAPAERAECDSIGGVAVASSRGSSLTEASLRTLPTATATRHPGRSIRLPPIQRLQSSIPAPRLSEVSSVAFAPKHGLAPREVVRELVLTVEFDF